MELREINKADYRLLEDFLYHAIFLPKGAALPPREIIYQPEIYIYIKNFGGKYDCGVVAESDGNIVAMAWTRIIAGYGHIDNNTPELAISVLPDYRGNGIGTKLMEYLFELLRKCGYKQTSLSVKKANLAVKFYKRLGYKIHDCPKQEDYLMIKEL